MPVVRFLERVGGAISGAVAKLLKFREILVFDPVYFDVEDQPDATIQGTTSDPGTGTGYTRVRPRTSPIARVRLPLVHGGRESTALASNSDAIMTTRPIQVGAEYVGATSVTIWVYAGRVEGVGTYYVELYNETDASSVAIMSSSTTPGALTGDAVSILALAEKTYSLRGWTADPAWAPTTVYVAGGTPSIVTNDGGKHYKCTTGGTSAGAGGPTGTGTGIADGSCVWDFLTSTPTVAVSQAEMRIS